MVLLLPLSDRRRINNANEQALHVFLGLYGICYRYQPTCGSWANLLVPKWGKFRKRRTIPIRLSTVTPHLGVARLHVSCSRGQHKRPAGKIESRATLAFNRKMPVGKGSLQDHYPLEELRSMCLVSIQPLYTIQKPMSILNKALLSTMGTLGAAVVLWERVSGDSAAIPVGPKRPKQAQGS